MVLATKPVPPIRLSLSFVFIRQPRRRKLPGFFLVVLATDLCAVLVQSPNHFAKNASNLTAVFKQEKSYGEKNNIIVSAKTLKCFSMAQSLHSYGALVMLLTGAKGK
ncbi:MAG: hypothetical protein A2203_05805 [Chromatiales bacterium RIFOXYA1_FULL_46_5]|nr:MAG: hypothetical protein A2203_05805 [Chromatiales bacterium RIFOXYA1_FULL_46_5]